MVQRQWSRTQPPQPKRPPGRTFRKVRADHALETAQDYVEAVSDIVHRQGVCRVKDLSAHMGVSHVTVSRIIARLLDEQLVETEPYRPIRLTAKGERLAAESRRRHDVVFRFLVALGVPDAEASSDAEGIEHHVGPATLQCMERFLAGQDTHEPSEETTS